LSSRVVIRKGQVNNNEAQRSYRQACLDTWYNVPRGEHGKKARRRAIVQYYCNGNYQSSVVEHFCPEGCYESEAAAKQMMIRLLPKAMLPYSASRMAQHRWTKLR
jgi:hypothetical protein